VQHPPLLAACFVLAGLVTAQTPSTVTTDEPTGFLAKSLTVGGSEHRYVVYVPRGYTKGKPWPLIVFLNGMGECGADGWKQVSVGLGAAIMDDWARWPFVVVFPQKPTMDSEWAAHDAMVMGMLAKTEADYAIDPARRFLTGLSQGGAGTWALGSKHADVWAAIAPVCGYGEAAEVAAGLKSVPIWAFHGLDDQTVPAQQSKDLVAGVEAAGGAPVLTLYEKTAHNSWDQAYRDSALAEWMRVGPRHVGAAQALAGKEISGNLTLFVARMSAQRGREVETLSLGTDGRPGWVWHRITERQGVDAAGPAEGRLQPADGARLLTECLCMLVRAGLYDGSPDPESQMAPAEGEYVGFDFERGFGGRSLSNVPRFVRVGDPERAQQLEALRTVATRLQQLQ